MIFLVSSPERQLLEKDSLSGGQAVSSRPDIVPPDYLLELERLQDQIPPFSDSDARAVMEEELGVPISSIFSELSPTSVAAASLGQVCLCAKSSLLCGFCH